MKRATRVLVPYQDVSKHIPLEWRDRVKVKIVESSPTSEIEQEPETDGFIIADVPHVDLGNPYKEAFDLFSEERGNPHDVSEPRAIEYTSPCIPGAIVVDPLLREAAKEKGLKVTNNAVWMLVVALREHTKNVLKNSMVLKKALETGQVYPPALHYPNVLAFSIRKDGKQHDKVTVPVKQPGPKRPINAMDILAAAERLPSGQIGSFGGSVSRLSLEQTFQSAFNAIPSCMVEKSFRDVQHFVSNELILLANNRKFDPSKRPGDPLTSTRTRPSQTSGPLLDATSPQSVLNNSSSRSFTVPGPSVGRQPPVAVQHHSMSTHSSNQAIGFNRNSTGDGAPSVPNPFSAIPLSEAVSRHDIPGEQSAAPQPGDQGTHHAPSEAQSLVIASSSAVPLDSAPHNAVSGSPCAIQPPATRDVEAAAKSGGSPEPPGLASPGQDQVMTGFPTAETTLGGHRPVFRGMGRGAKNLAALMSRTAAAASSTPASSEASPLAEATSAPAAASPSFKREREEGTVEEVGDGEHNNSASNGSEQNDATKSGPPSVSGEPTVRGKGFGTKDLAAMRARAAGGASPGVDRTGIIEGEDAPMNGPDDAENGGVGAGGETPSSSA